MIGTFGTQAQEVRSAALCLSPVDLEGLDKDLSFGLGAGYRYLSLKAPAILSRSRSANPHPHCGRWAFDIDGFVFVTAIPYEGMSKARGAKEAREVLEAVLDRATRLADGNGWNPSSQDAIAESGRPMRAAAHRNNDVPTYPEPSARARRPFKPIHLNGDGGIDASPIALPSDRPAAVAGALLPSRGSRGMGRPSHSRDRSNGTFPVANRVDARALDAALDAAHYTRLPQWVLAGALPLTVSERILLADVMDVMGSGAALSYKADRARIAARCGLKPSTATAALRALAAKEILQPVAGARGRFTVAWTRLADFAKHCEAGARAVGSAATEADVRHRLNDAAKGLALPAWAVQLCGATEAALLLAKAWAMGHGGGDGRVWASGTTLASWLPGNERSLRRARASLAEQGLAQTTAQYTYCRLYNTGAAKNKTVEMSVNACALARALAVRGIDFGADLTAVVSAFFANDATLSRDAALWDAQLAAKARVRRIRRTLATLALQGHPAALAARSMVDAGSTSRMRAPWRPKPLKALPAAA